MCVSTIWIRKYQQEVPCGKCFECVKRRRNDWYIRALIESRYRRFTYFGLLTYAEVGMSLHKRDIQLFLKRLRSYGYKFSYMIVGEYGEKKDRPHWHCLIFADDPVSYSHISQAWKGGYETDEVRNKAGWIRFELIRSARSIRYTVKYVYKYAGIDPRFVLMVSKNPAIGKSFLVNQAFYLKNETTALQVDGRKMAMPRYYKRKIFEGYEDIKQNVNDRLAATVAELREKEFQVFRSLHPGLTDSEIENLIKKNKLIYQYEFRKRENCS